MVMQMTFNPSDIGSNPIGPIIELGYTTNNKIIYMYYDNELTK